MTYPILAVIFFLTVLISVGSISCLILKPSLWVKYKPRIKVFLVLWFVPYFAFILFFTGPVDISRYPPRESSPYKLPWQAGVTRFVSQGNRSFTSHRDFFEYSWDFWMPIGTPILAARAGKVVEVVDHFDGIGFNSNYLMIEHEDGTRAGYAHIKKNGSLVKAGDLVSQGQPIALSGMVGQTVNPHLHFGVINLEKTSSIPISFFDVPGGVPLAGHFYVSGNQATKQ